MFTGNSKHGGPKDNPSTRRKKGIDARLRHANAVLAAALVAFFLVHACCGAISQIWPLPDGLLWTVWIFASLIIVHIVACVGTSYCMLTDTLRPPSVAKKRHLLLKWASGVLLLAAVLLHVFGPDEFDIALMVVLLGVLVWHSYVGVKSLVRDVGLPRSMKVPLRAGLIVFAVLIALLVLYATAL